MRRLLLLQLLLLPGLLAAFQPDWSRLQGLARGKVEVSGTPDPRPPRGPANISYVTLTTISSHNLVMKHLPGADPELVLLNFRYEELERIPLSHMTRAEINQLVQDLGFYRKAERDAPVPPEFQQAPAKTSDLREKVQPQETPKSEEQNHPDL
uniref:Selenoprotein M n=1 Tax=Ornithorhynchus anatinus TaxID=9258 RepID=F6YVK1_ORNAN